MISTNEKSIINRETFVMAPARKMKAEDETLPHVITRKFDLCLTKNRYDKSNGHG